MLVQKADADFSGTLQPPVIRAPLWDELVKQWSMIPAPVYSSAELGPDIVSVGRYVRELDDYTAGESADADSHGFGWDNENPCRQVKVGGFRVDFRPIIIKESYDFWVGGADERYQASFPLTGSKMAAKSRFAWFGNLV